MQTIDRAHDPAARNLTLGQRLHAKHRNALLYELRHYVLFETAEVRIHDVDWHLNRIEVKTVLPRHFQHI